MDADGPHRFRNGPFGRDVVQAPGGASDLSHSETRCAAFAGAGASSASTTCRFRESIPHPVQPLSTLRTPRYRDARKTRSRPACSALDGPDFHWQAHSSFPIAPRIRLSDKTSRLHPRHVVPKPAQAYEPKVPVKMREWIGPALATPGFVLELQPPAQPHRCVAVECPIRLADGAYLEVVRPSAQRAVHLAHQLCGFLPCPRSVRQCMDLLNHALDALLRWPVSPGAPDRFSLSTSVCSATIWMRRARQSG